VLVVVPQVPQLILLSLPLALGNPVAVLDFKIFLGIRPQPKEFTRPACLLPVLHASV
tara:strand:+ start:172 stop:342 length:171 start_codon:yes stop_codon:yes gene_type:complete